MGGTTCSCVERDNPHDDVHMVQRPGPGQQFPEADLPRNHQKVSPRPEPPRAAVLLDASAREPGSSFCGEDDEEMQQRLGMLERANSELVEERQTWEQKAAQVAKENEQLRADLLAVARQRELWKARAVQTQQETMAEQQALYGTAPLQQTPRQRAAASSESSAQDQRAPAPPSGPSTVSPRPHVGRPIPRPPARTPDLARQSADEPSTRLRDSPEWAPEEPEGGSAASSPRKLSPSEHREATERAVKALFDLSPDLDTMQKALAAVAAQSPQASPRSPGDAEPDPSPAAALEPEDQQVLAPAPPPQAAESHLELGEGRLDLS